MIFLNLSINLDEFLVSLFQLNLNNIHISIFGSGNLSVDRLSQRSSINCNAEDSIHLFEVQVPYLEGKVMLSLSIDDLNLCTLARNSVNINMYVSVLGRVDDSSPPTTNMLTLNHHLTLLFTITITVHHGVVNNHLEKSITNYISSIKFNVQYHLIAVGLLDNLLQIIKFQVELSSFQWMSNILVLESHVNTKKVKSFVHFPHNCLSPHPGLAWQSSSLASCSHG